MRRISLGLLVAVLLPALAAGASKGTKLTLVAYSTPKDAYGQLISAFQQTRAGNGVSFSQSYGASGEQSRAVAAGLDADVVAFSLEPDITSLVQKKLVAKSWNKGKYRGMVTRSVVVFVVRDGNPKKLKTWNDLLKPGVQVITPNPFTSGGARWNVMAAYGGALRSGKAPAQAVDYLGKLWQHVVGQPTSAREGLQTFLAGRGDVFLAYENEAVFAQKKGQPVQFVIPKATILIENPIAVTTTSKHKTEAKAFLKFLRTTPAQKIFAQNGYRPVVSAAARGFSFPTRPQLFTIKYVGGWAKVEQKFFDPKTGIMARFQGSSGG
jgi:sulfate/thiosulfate transport system substrate-binding protein